MSKLLQLIILATIELLARLLPHPASASPTLACALLWQQQLGRKAVIYFCSWQLLLSILLGLYFGYPLLGSWTLVNLSFYALLLLIVTKNKSRYWLPVYSVCFWLWSNFGTWLFSGLYDHNCAEFYRCYLNALPFLWTGILGDIFWGLFLFSLYRVPGIKRNTPTACPSI